MLVLDGKAVSKDRREKLKSRVQALVKKTGRPPQLTVIIVGEHLPSQVYVRNKQKAGEQTGLTVVIHRRPATSTREGVLALVAQLNGDDGCDGILVQSPLPSAMGADAERRVFDAIRPEKDVDGFHPINVGKLVQNRATLVACTPTGVIEILERSGIPIAGSRAVVIGRSDIVGKPMALLLLHRHATVTIAHTRTSDLPAYCRRAEILCVAIGHAEFIRGDWIKPGATVIDIGINRVDAGGKSRIVGDVNFAEALDVAGAVTPVPGGVGPMTIACLLSNTLRAACMQAGLPAPEI